MVAKEKSYKNSDSGSDPFFKLFHLSEKAIQPQKDPIVGYGNKTVDWLVDLLEH